MYPPGTPKLPPPTVNYGQYSVATSYTQFVEREGWRERVRERERERERGRERERERERGRGREREGERECERERENRLLLFSQLLCFLLLSLYPEKEIIRSAGSGKTFEKIFILLSPEVIFENEIGIRLGGCRNAAVEKRLHDKDRGCPKKSATNVIASLFRANFSLQ
jgi:hypothetical protein